MEDPRVLGDLEVTTIQPYQAVKSYHCPGCGRAIPPGTGHVVVVPVAAVDLRRHWHKGCWAQLLRRPHRTGA